MSEGREDELKELSLKTADNYFDHAGSDDECDLDDRHCLADYIHTALATALAEAALRAETPPATSRSALDVVKEDLRKALEHAECRTAMEERAVNVLLVRRFFDLVGRAETPAPRDEECICQGNWRKLAQETETLFGKEFESNGDVYTLEGLVHTEEDYYYGMRRQRDGRWTLLSCVANIEGHHFKRRAAGEPEQAK
jgi:hypothetical protein